VKSSFSNRLLALIRQPRKANAAKPLHRPMPLALEALEDRLVPATVTGIRLPPPPPQYSFVFSNVPASVGTGANFQVNVKEVDSTGQQVTSGGVGSANIYVNQGGKTSYVETITMAQGLGTALLFINTTGTATIEASYTVSGVPGAEAITISGQTSVVVLPKTGAIWSGYAITPTPFYATTAVGGSWVQPTVTGPSGAQVATWVGMDGSGSSTVEQVGTWATVGSNGQTQYQAWWEFFGDQSTTGVGPAYHAQYLSSTSFPVHAGDTISGDVVYLSRTSSTSTFLLQITDTPAGGGKVEQWSSKETTTYVVPARSSAEWIVENPNNASQSLANYGTLTFTGAWATIAGTTGAISDFSNVAVMNIVGNDWKSNVENTPPNYLSSLGFNEPASGMGSSSFLVRWSVNYSTGPYQNNGASGSTVTGTVVAVIAGAAQTVRPSAEPLDEDPVPATAAALVLDNCFLPTSHLTLAVNGGKTISSHEDFWADLADPHAFDSAWGASYR